MEKKRINLAQQLGFNKEVTNEIIEGLKNKKTKASEEVLKRMALLKKRGVYQVIRSEKQFTVISEVVVTQQEIKQFTNLLKVEYVLVSELMQENELWIEWVRTEY